jgi:3-hydroxyacyl-[acyl-carrier-protein] dehydratase
VAFKNVTVNEDFFQGHFPHKPLMPAVLMIEALAQTATLLLLDEVGGRQGAGVHLRGVDGAKFRKHVVPGDQLKLMVTLGAARGPLVKATAIAEVDGQTVVEAELLFAIQPIVDIDPLARVSPTAVIGAGTSVGAFAVSVRMSASAATARSARRR